MKICTKCKVEKDVALFFKDKSRKDGLYVKCKDCAKKYAENNKDKMQRYNAKYYADHKDKIKECRAKHQLNNRARRKEYWANNKHITRRCNAKARDNLLDRYVRWQITRRSMLKAKDIPEGVVEAKRMQMLINRTLKEMKNAKHE